MKAPKHCFGAFIFQWRCSLMGSSVSGLLVEFLLAQLLDVDGLEVLLAVDNARLDELLTTAHLFHHTGFVEFAFQLLQSSLEVFTFFNGNYDHC